MKTLVYIIAFTCVLLLYLLAGCCETLPFGFWLKLVVITCLATLASVWMMREVDKDDR